MVLAGRHGLAAYVAHPLAQAAGGHAPADAEDALLLEVPLARLLLLVSAAVANGDVPGDGELGVWHLGRHGDGGAEVEAAQ